MIPGVNPKQLKQAMKRMGMNQEDIPAREVLIKTDDKDIIISNPEVLKITMGGQDSFQITGHIQERESKAYTEEDIKTVVQQAKCSEEEAIEALENSKGDLAEAILSFQA